MLSPQIRKVVLIELNEITWRFVDPFLKDGTLPVLADLIKRGTRATPMRAGSAPGS